MMSVSPASWRACSIAATLSYRSARAGRRIRYPQQTTLAVGSLWPPGRGGTPTRLRSPSTTSGTGGGELGS